ncbi:hypothetical protein ACROYT_G025963 [Oculina patagonica]
MNESMNQSLPPELMNQSLPPASPVFLSLINNSSSSGNENNANCKSLSEDSSLTITIKIVVYSFVLIVSLFGNSTIIAITARNKRMQTTTNHLIANMAASDLLITIIAVPLKLCEIVVVSRRWLIDGIVGLILCKVLYFLRDISTAVSILSLVFIAFDRYRGIVFPLHPPIITPKLCKVVIALVWFTSMTLLSFYFYAFRLVSDNKTTNCDFSWAPDLVHRRTEQYVTVVFVLIIILPFCIITFLYSRIIWSLRKEEATRQLPSTIARRQRYEENIKVFKNICAIVVAFAFCILPTYIFTMLYYFVWNWKMPCNMEQYGFAVHFVLYSNAAISPVIFYVFNARYREGLKDMLRRFHCWPRDNRVIINPVEIELNNL